MRDETFEKLYEQFAKFQINIATQIIDFSHRTGHHRCTYLVRTRRYVPMPYSLYSQAIKLAFVLSNV